MKYPANYICNKVLLIPIREGVSSHIKNSRQLSIRCPVGGCTGTVAQTNLKPNHKLRALLDRAEES